VVALRRLLCWTLLVPAAAHGITLRVTVADATQPVDLVFTATPETTGDPGDTRQETRLRVLSGDRAELPLPGKGAWTLRLETPGYFAPPTMVASSPADAVFEVRVWPTEPLVVVVEVDRRQALPTTVTARFSASDPNDHRFPRGEVPCAVETIPPRATCEIPLGGPFDLVLQAPGYAGDYLWGLVHRHGAPARPASWRLTRGGSVTGFVEAAGRDLDPARCTVELEPVVADLQGSDRQAAQLEKRGTQVHPDRRGFFQLADVAAGSYRVRASQEGYSEAVAGPVAVAKGAESRLGSPLELVRPFALEVDVEPPVDAHQQPWRVQLDRGESASSRVFHVCDLRTSRQGTALCPDLAPAPYSIRVEDSAGSTWYADRFDLDGPGAPLWISLPLLEVSGRVTLGDEPLATGLEFRNQVGAVAIAATSGQDGRYSVVLPRKKVPWEVEIGTADNYPLKRFPEIDLRPVAGSGGKVTADFALSGAELRGRVVDEEQQSAKAVVAGRCVEDQFATRTGDDGSFAARALTPGPCEIHAQGLAGVSERRSVAASEDEEPPEIVLVLHPELRFTVRVTAPDGRPVPGAGVTWWGLDPAGERIDGDSSATGLDGSFPSQRRREDAALVFFVSANGFPLLTQTTGAPSAGQDVELTLGAAAGTIELAYDVPGGRPSEALDAAHPGIRFFWRGVELAYQEIRQWALLHGEPAANREFPSRIAALPPGKYDACWDDSFFRPEAWRSVVGPSPGSQCASGELAPGGTLVLEVPAFRPPATSGGRR
jgi:hypothetical protein